MSKSRKKILRNVIIVFIPVTIVLIIAWTTGPFNYHFASPRLVNVYSLIQIFTTAYVSLLICRYLEKESSLRWQVNSSARPFFICTLGFAFLGFDDLLSLHEAMDKVIHFIFRIKETPLTDHLDDIILPLYGVIAIFFIKDFMREFGKHPYMIGLIAAFTNVRTGSKARQI